MQPKQSISCELPHNLFVCLLAMGLRHKISLSLACLLTASRRCTLGCLSVSLSLSLQGKGNVRSPRTWQAHPRVARFGRRTVKPNPKCMVEKEAIDYESSEISTVEEKPQHLSVACTRPLSLSLSLSVLPSGPFRSSQVSTSSDTCWMVSYLGSCPGSRGGCEGSTATTGTVPHSLGITHHQLPTLPTEACRKEHLDEC